MKCCIFKNKDDLLDFVNLRKVKQRDIINILQSGSGYELFYHDKKGKYELKDNVNNTLIYIMFGIIILMFVLQMVKVL